MNELTVPVSGPLTTQKGSDDAFRRVSEGDFFPKLRLYTKGQAVDNAKISPGHYGIPNGSADVEADLGNRVDVLPLARLMRAEDWGDEKNPLFSYDIDKPLFQQIIDTAAQGGEDNPCRWGCEFLLYERSTGRVLTYYLYGRARTEAERFYPFLPVTQADIESGASTEAEPRDAIPITLTARLKGRRYPSHVPVVQRCSTPFEHVPSFERQVAKFLNVADSNVELSDGGAETSRAR